MAQLLAMLHARATPGSSPPQERRAASAALWWLVSQQYQAGVPTGDLAAVLCIKPASVRAQLRHHGYLGGVSASMPLRHIAAGPFTGPTDRPGPPSTAPVATAVTAGDAPPASARPRRSRSPRRRPTCSETDQLRCALARGRHHPDVEATLLQLDDAGVDRAHLAAVLGLTANAITHRIRRARRRHQR